MNNKLLFFGCSFTNVESSKTNIQFENYRYKLSKNANLNHKSYAEPGKSNEHIIDDIYHYSNAEIDKNDIFVIQYSFFDRLGMRMDICNDEFISMCKRENPENFNDKVRINLYNHWLKYFYSKKGSIIEFEKNVNLISNWLNSKGIKFISIGFDLDMDLFSDKFYEKNNFVKFGNTFSMYKTAIEEKLRIYDLGTTEEYNDYHLNETGHMYLSNKITDKLKELEYII
jgi:hypothetical protein